MTKLQDHRDKIVRLTHEQQELKQKLDRAAFEGDTRQVAAHKKEIARLEDEIRTHEAAIRYGEKIAREEAKVDDLAARREAMAFTKTSLEAAAADAQAMEQAIEQLGSRLRSYYANVEAARAALRPWGVPRLWEGWGGATWDLEYGIEALVHREHVFPKLELELAQPSDLKGKTLAEVVTAKNEKLLNHSERYILPQEVQP